MNYAQVKGDAVRAQNQERNKLTNLSAARVTLPDRRSRERHPISIIGESHERTYNRGANFHDAEAQALLGHDGKEVESHYSEGD